MQTCNVLLTSINDVKNFVNAATAQSCDVDLVSGRYVVDAKSIMGIFSVDLSKPIRLEFHGSEAEFAAFREQVKNCIAE